MRAIVLTAVLLATPTLSGAGQPASDASPDLIESMRPLSFGQAGLHTDLAIGSGSQPLPMDTDGDGDLDLLVVSTNVPVNGLYLYENVGSNDNPLFTTPRRLSHGLQDAAISYVDGDPIVTTPRYVYPDVATSGFVHGEQLPFEGTVHEPLVPGGQIRGYTWPMVDFDADGALDVVVGVGDWSEYGWDAAFDENGNWTNGPLHGFVYLLRNTGTTASPTYAAPVKVEAGGSPIDVYGKPAPQVVDVDGDGLLDIVTGEQLDRFTYFRNIGTATAPEYAAGVRIRTESGDELHVDEASALPSAVDWNGDGLPDLVLGNSDGRVALSLNTGTEADGAPVFTEPAFLQQEADLIKDGALTTPAAVDWNGDGKTDLISGNSNGRLTYFENLDGNDPPAFAAGRSLTAGGVEIRHQAGSNGSVQGPAEAKWGYTVPSVADWNGDGLPDILVNDSWGKVVWYENVGTRTAPELAPSQPIEVAWEGATPKPAWTWWTPTGDELVTQWRTTPYAFDLNEDGLMDLVMLDTEGYLVFHERRATGDGLELMPGARIFIGEAGSSKFDQKGRAVDAPRGPLQMNVLENGQSGRRKFTFVDWNRDGRLDILANNGSNVGFLENVGTDAEPWVFADRGSITDGKLVGHTTNPTIVDWNGDGLPDVVIGAEDGHFYYQPWNYTETQPRVSQPPAQVNDLVGQWNLDDVTGGMAADSSGYGNDAEVKGAQPVMGQSGAGLRFDGFNDYLQLDYTVGPYLDGAAGITFSAWVRPATLEPGIRKLFGTRINSGAAGMEVQFENDHGQPRIAVAGRSAASDSYQKVVFDAQGIAAGQWHRIDAVLDFANDEIRLYVDGTVRQAVDGDTSAAFGASAYTRGTPSQTDVIGRGPDGNNYFRGDLDEIQIRRHPKTS